MNPNELPLRDIHLPEPVGWWPPAPGWWLAAILLPLALWACMLIYRRITRASALKTAKKILAAIKQDTGGDDYDKLCRISVLLRRTAISLAPRSEVAGLTGRAWLAYLDASMPGRPFSDGAGKQLIEAPYRERSSLRADLPELLTLCENWLKAQSKRKP
ncbi:MAG: DUF4381 domain-containing protein [Gammaproteobacteria bacterium]